MLCSLAVCRAKFYTTVGRLLLVSLVGRKGVGGYRGKAVAAACFLDRGREGWRGGTAALLCRLAIVLIMIIILILTMIMIILVILVILIVR